MYYIGPFSLWSGLSSRASIPANGARVDVPAIVLGYTGDNGVFPAEAQLIYDSLGIAAKELVDIEADHYGYPIRVADDAGAGVGAQWGRDVALQRITDWLRAGDF